MPAQYNIIIRKSADYNAYFALANEAGEYLDLAGCSAVAKYRPDLASATVASFTATVEYIEERERWEIHLSLTDVETAAITLTDAVYDIILTDGSGLKTTVLEGSVTVQDSVSR